MVIFCVVILESSSWSLLVIVLPLFIIDHHFLDGSIQLKTVWWVMWIISASYFQHLQVTTFTCQVKERKKPSMKIILKFTVFYVWICFFEDGKKAVYLRMIFIEWFLLINKWKSLKEYLYPTLSGSWGREMHDSSLNLSYYKYQKLGDYLNVMIGFSLISLISQLYSHLCLH